MIDRYAKLKDKLGDDGKPLTEIVKTDKKVEFTFAVFDEEGKRAPNDYKITIFPENLIRERDILQKQLDNINLAIKDISDAPII